MVVRLVRRSLYPTSNFVLNLAFYRFPDVF